MFLWGRFLDQCHYQILSWGSAMHTNCFWPGQIHKSNLSEMTLPVALPFHFCRPSDWNWRHDMIKCRQWKTDFANRSAKIASRVQFFWDVGILGHSFLHPLITIAGWHSPPSLIASLSVLLMSRCGTEVWCFTKGELRTEPSYSIIKTRLKPHAWTGLCFFFSRWLALRGNFIRDQLLYTAHNWWKGPPYAVFQYTNAGCHPNLKAAAEKCVGRATSEGLKWHIFR